MNDTPLGPTPDYPDRPSHPDFARLVDLVLQLDGTVRERPDGSQRSPSDDDGIEGVDAIVAGIVDPESLSYMAFQRSLRGTMLGGEPTLRGAALYLEAFIMGFRYHQRFGAK